ncbi:hypothetical protein [Thiomonas sp.]
MAEQLYEIRKPPSRDDPTMQLWSPDGHWIAEIRERAWPGSAARILAALNAMTKLRELCDRFEAMPNEQKEPGISMQIGQAQVLDEIRAILAPVPPTG